MTQATTCHAGSHNSRCPDGPDVGGRLTTDLPLRAGVGLRPEHYRDILESAPDMGWFEVHPENYMGAGGAPHHYLSAIRERYPLSLHGVGLSIGGHAPLDEGHLARVAKLAERYQVASVSEHLAWSTHDGLFANDLLPVPYTQESLSTVCDHIDRFQEVCGRRILLENPSTYLAFQESTMTEIEFLDSIAKRTGCGLLLDVNNVFVSATNLQWSPEDYIDEFPHGHVGELHLGGHAPDRDADGTPLLIDSHDRVVAEAVWRLFRRTVAVAEPVPTLIEWDSDLPPWSVLYDEAIRAERILLGTRVEKAGHAVAS